MVPTGINAAVVGATPVNKILGLPQARLPAASDSKKVFFWGAPPGKI